ncbi:MAG: radical SAM protein [Sandaracinaceae bacterium]|nr:radical SAM protein [Sandaracinaceae bacterium]
MEPDRQIEIQLGHMCNNRCVFCVSGQRTALGQAGPTPVEPVLRAIRLAREAGHRKITLLGGEPTLQPGFMRIVEETVRLGFEEIVIFTNGAKTARPALVDAVRATGGRFTWRISIQGATRESHERTTRKPGSFGRIERTLANLAARGERITVNMCLVGSNYEDVDRFPTLLAPYGVSQLHLDLMRPLDAGDRTEAELRAAMPPLSTLVPPLRRMVAGFPVGFDVNLGNLPFCVAPDLAPWIHHDGAATETIAVDGDDRLSRPWDKYLVKRRDKIKPPSCADCVLAPRCSGVFETYARFHGLAELRPIDATALRDADPNGELLGVWAPPLLAPARCRVRSDHALDVTLDGVTASLDAHGGDLARYQRFGVRGLEGAGDVTALARLLARLDAPVHPLGPAAPPALRAPLERLRRAAPFGGLRWTGLEVGPDRVELALESASARAALWIAHRGRPSGGYRVEEGTADEAMVDGLRQAMRALGPARAEPAR